MNKNILLACVLSLIGCASQPVKPAPDLQSQNQNLCSLGFNCIVDGNYVYKAENNDSTWGVYNADVK